MREEGGGKRISWEELRKKKLGSTCGRARESRIREEGDTQRKR